MTVDDLIAELLQYDKHAEVFFNAEEDGHIYSVDELTSFDNGYGPEVILVGEEQ